MLLQSLPSEILEEIVEHLDAPSDLAALSSVCKGLRCLISSGVGLGRLQCRHLAVTMDNLPILSELASKPYLAHAVRKLYLLEGLHTISSKGIWHELGRIPRESDSDRLAMALRQMNRLESLTYLGIYANEVGGDFRPRFDGVSDLIFSSTCANLARLCLSDVTIGDRPLPQFPRLRALWLDAVNCKYGHFALFLHRHPRLEQLHCPGDRATSPALPTLPTLLPDTLPNLRYLQADLDQKSFLILVGPLSAGAYRPLEWIYIDSEAHIFVDLCAHLANIPTLCAIETGSFNLANSIESEKFRALCSVGPKVNTLSYVPYCDEGNEQHFLECMTAHCEGLAKLNGLQFLKDFLLGDKRSSRLHRAVVEQLGSYCPNLSSVDEWVRVSSGVWEIDACQSPHIIWPLIDDSLPRGLFSCLR